jgi:hypothetical protein
MSKHTNVNPDHYKVAGRERQGEDVIHEIERREAKRLRQEARRSRTTRAAGISNRMSPEEEARDAAQHPPVDTGGPPPQDAAGRVGEQPLEAANDRQTSHKAGSRSMGQKEAETRYPDRSAPPSRKVSGAFGRVGKDSRARQDQQ